jgi:hypothetical protein
VTEITVECNYQCLNGVLRLFLYWHVEDLDVEMCHYGIIYGGSGVKSLADNVPCLAVSRIDLCS